MKTCVREFHDSSDGCIHQIIYDDSTGDYTDYNVNLDVSDYVSRDCRYVCGDIY